MLWPIYKVCIVGSLSGHDFVFVNFIIIFVAICDQVNDKETINGLCYC